MALSRGVTAKLQNKPFELCILHTPSEHSSGLDKKKTSSKLKIRRQFGRGGDGRRHAYREGVRVLRAIKEEREQTRERGEEVGNQRSSSIKRAHGRGSVVAFLDS